MAESGGEAAEEWDKKKSAIMQELLGPEHDMVMHSMIPYAIGGSLDLYYYPSGIPGTAIATKECCELPGKGSKNSVFDSYELVMFTKQVLAIEQAQDESTPFGKVHSKINAVLNCMAPYSAEACLNPGETCEFPADMEVVGGKCLIFDSYGNPPKRKKLFGLLGEIAPFGLLVVIEVFRSEMEFARRKGGAVLLEKLKEAGYYPYSDLNRQPVA